MKFGNNPRLETPVKKETSDNLLNHADLPFVILWMTITILGSIWSSFLSYQRYEITISNHHIYYILIQIIGILNANEKIRKKIGYSLVFFWIALDFAHVFMEI